MLERETDPRRVGTSKSKIPIQKSKRDDCSNYRDIRLLNSGYKIYAKIITQRFKTVSEAILLEEQNGFRRGRSCIDNVFTVKQKQKKKRIQLRNAHSIPGFKKKLLIE
jgi:hypothetical protein